MYECQLNIRILTALKNELKKEAVELGLSLRKYLLLILSSRDNHV